MQKEKEALLGRHYAPSVTPRQPLDKLENLQNILGRPTLGKHRTSKSSVPRPPTMAMVLRRTRKEDLQRGFGLSGSTQIYTVCYCI